MTRSLYLPNSRDNCGSIYKSFKATQSAAQRPDLSRCHAHEDSIAMRRLSYIMQAVTVRRTGCDSLFGAPHTAYQNCDRPHNSCKFGLA
jgi:hypothetical protein